MDSVDDDVMFQGNATSFTPPDLHNRKTTGSIAFLSCSRGDGFDDFVEAFASKIKQL